MLPASCTLIVPHQRATSGGVYVIERFARHLADRAEVRLAVRRGPTRPIAGVEVLDAPQLSAAELPDADVLIGGLAQPDAARLLTLPAAKGEPLFMFQGYGVAENPRVIDLLRRGPRVLAVSEFLCERARAHGCAVELTRPGLDRSIFHPGGTGEDRDAVVSMMTHADAGKAMRDGLEALAHVHAAAPAARLVLFGGHQPDTDLPVSFLGPLPRTEVAALLRGTRVFICPSLEEGLGLPGIEALACGAALASTDTKGGRDYAVHEQTALVSPPGQPAALAENAIRLLRERDLRARLRARALAHLAAAYPPWPQAAAHFHGALARLLSSAPTKAPTGP